jgi:hypothetical protein
MFIPSANYHKEEEAFKPTKTHYPSNPKPSFNPKKEVKRETPKPRVGAFICRFCDRAGQLNEFCFRWKRIEKRHLDYTGNSYHDEFIDFPPHFYSRIPPCPYSHASPRTFSCALPHFSHGLNHRSNGFGSRENNFVPICFGYGPCPHCGDHFLRRPSFSAGGTYTHPEPKHLVGPRFPRRGSCPTGPNGEVQRNVKTSSCHMIKCWIPKIYLTNPSTEPSTFSHPM